MAFQPLLMMDIEEEYEKNPDLKREDVKDLRNWLSKQRYLPNITDLELALFLHANRFDMQATKQILDEHFTVRTHVPEFFAERDPKQKALTEALNVVTFAPLPGRSALGERVLCCRLRDCEPTRYSFVDAVRAFLLVQDLDALRHGTAPGQLVVFDMTGATMAHLTRMGPLAVKKFLYYLQEVLPARLTGVHYINVVPFVDRLIALMRPFLKKELLNVLHFHQGVEPLYEFVPQKCLPKDYGGEGPTMDELHDKTVADLLKHRSVFIEEEETRRVNESLRPGGPKNAGDIFGIEASFKQLDID